MENKTFIDDEMDFNNFNLKDLVSPFASKKNRERANQGLKSVVNNQKDVLQSVINPLRRKSNTIAFFGGLSLTQRMERKNRLKQLSKEQYNTIVLNALGNRRLKTGFYSLQARDFLKNLRLKALEKKKVLEALAEAKSQSQLESLKQQLSELQSAIDKAKQELQQNTQVPIQQVEKVVQNIQEQPQLNIDEQIEEIETDVVDEMVDNKDEKTTNNEVGNNVVENLQTTIKDKSSKLPNWLLPAVIVGGVAYFIFRKK